jgi:hypothetical protein
VLIPAPFADGREDVSDIDRRRHVSWREPTPQDPDLARDARRTFVQDAGVRAARRPDHG